MPRRSLDDWMDFWDNLQELSPRKINLKKTKMLLEQYVLDSDTGASGFISSCDWYWSSKGTRVDHFCSPRVALALDLTSAERVFENAIIETLAINLLLARVERAVTCSYEGKPQEIKDIPEGDELLFILEVINVKASIDYFNLSEPEDACNNTFRA